MLRFPIEERADQIRRTALERVADSLSRADLVGGRLALADEPPGEEGLFLWANVLERFLSDDTDGALDLLALARSEYPDFEAFTRRDRVPDRPPTLMERYFGPMWAAHPSACDWLNRQPGFRQEPPPSQFDLAGDAGSARYAEGLFRLFEESAEGLELREQGGRPRWIGLVLHYLLHHLNVTPATMEAADLEEVLFEILPVKGSLDDADVCDVITEVRAFCAFLGRRFELPSAAELASVCDPQAGERLRRAIRGRIDP